MEKLTREEALRYQERLEQISDMPDDKINMVYNAGKLNSLILGVIHAALEGMEGMEGMDFTQEQTQAILHECENVFDTYTAAEIRQRFPY